MQVVDRESVLWNYLPTDIKGLIIDGEKLLDHAAKHGNRDSTDFSYLVFSFSKAYEGFLKRLFLDLDLIKEDDYYGDDIRIGRILNPNYIREHENVFGGICSSSDDGTDLAERMWEIWREGRNQLFHYFPHNFRRISFEDAVRIINEMVGVMEASVSSCSIRVGEVKDSKKKTSSIV